MIPRYHSLQVFVNCYCLRIVLVLPKHKALDDRKGSRSNDDLDHILGKKDRNWLNF